MDPGCAWASINIEESIASVFGQPFLTRRRCTSIRIPQSQSVRGARCASCSSRLCERLEILIGQPRQLALLIKVTREAFVHLCLHALEGIGQGLTIFDQWR